jgi:Glycosyl hydrolase family 26
MKATIKHTRFRTTGIGALAAAALILAALLGPGCAAAKKPPALYWGAQIGDQLTGEQAPWDMNAVYKFERLAQKKMSLVGFSSPFAACKGKHCSFYSFPLTPMENLRTHGTIPFFSWSSSSDADSTTHDPLFRLAKVAHGKYDRYIREFARAAAAWGHPFFLRFNWEMNGNWFPWSGGVNGNNSHDYVAAWRHVHDIFRQEGATNASWVWCPNVGEEEGLRKLYPGGKYVDWTCLDGYNWGTRFFWSRWLSFDKVFRASYRRVLRIAPGKPMVLGEVASTTYGGNKSAWIKHFLHVVPAKYPGIKGLIWFDVNDRGTRWPIESPRNVTKAFAKGISNPAYQPNRYSQISASPIPLPRR